jgi:hypothetical protein
MVSHPEPGVVGSVVVVDFEPIFSSLDVRFPSDSLDDDRDAEVPATSLDCVVCEPAKEFVHMRALRMFLPESSLKLASRIFWCAE